MNYVSDYASGLGPLVERVGARGRALAEMADLGLPVPPGFAVSDVACRRFLETGDIPPEAWSEIQNAAQITNAEFRNAGPQRPVLFSVRSSPAIDMPGLFDSALYLGATEPVLEELARWGGERVAARSRLGFLKTLGRLRGLSPARYSSVVAEIVGPNARREWSVPETDAVCVAYQALVVDESQRPIPQDLNGQLLEGIEAVFASWDRLEARRFRAKRGISDDDGMGLVVHPMIFGTVDESGAGVVFSRDPQDGRPGVAGSPVCSIG